jgi:hypothetical protein
MPSESPTRTPDIPCQPRRRPPILDLVHGNMKHLRNIVSTFVVYPPVGVFDCNQLILIDHHCRILDVPSLVEIVGAIIPYSTTGLEQPRFSSPTVWFLALAYSIEFLYE